MTAVSYEVGTLPVAYEHCYDLDIMVHGVEVVKVSLSDF